MGRMRSRGSDQLIRIIRVIAQLDVSVSWSRDGDEKQRAEKDGG